MATDANKTHCVTCGKEKRAVRCEGCLQLFCYDHFTIHRQDLNNQLDEIEINRDLFRQTLNEQTNHPQIHILIQEIDQWEKDSIKTIQQTASECRQILIQHTTKSVHQIEVNLTRLTNQLRDTRQDNDFNEYDLNQFNQKSKHLAEELDKLINVSILHNSEQLISKISVVVPSGELLSPVVNQDKIKWKKFGKTFAGGYGEGSQLNQLFYPDDMFLDNDEQRIYIADSSNHRIMKWKFNATSGQIVAGGNGQGDRLDQLNQPTHVIVDRSNECLIICDRGNGRVVRWYSNDDLNQEIVVSNIDCSCIALDNSGNLYVSDWENNEVRRWKDGDKTGTVVAGGHGKGSHLNQLYHPSYIVVGEDHELYISDCENHRVIKWMKGAKEGMVIAGGHGQGNSLTQLSSPTGLAVDDLGNVYIADCYNHRVVRWSKGSREGTLIVGGNGRGKQPDQLGCPTGILFDRHENLYVVDWGNNRVQKFDIDPDKNC
ncbi:unnamed protein product [Adineta steineri]|uniref:Uncharacterized protein n=1 Tax=Adineta steineri TaxID=433720 RepID=A0A814FST2_9BILA|nr:unnamed protein product [Adineta steineri]